jgi:hypothetical protein
MFHPIQWCRQRRIRALQLRLLELDMEIERYQKCFDLLVSTTMLASRMPGRMRLIDLNVDIARCQFVLDQVGPRLIHLKDEKFETVRKRRSLELLIEQN